ncbi:flavodoxin [Heliobacterium gestii]|uniref:Flavodoxin n=1 Tax=Heliomicrobium gestii TaxID=2699 RepID=A0A845LIP4_HELGE|nr:flavodoxin domain-containing protein [Heliomicrobium gestii]MBM7866481.1 menaquinone-dependent protoporphyrinogen oxidase [Heliomicrobium gestii]MZP42736.1 flavodoxin [Heliomicrobium gestii]
MSTVICYLSKRGTTEYCAKRLADLIDDSVELVDIRKNPVGPDWSAFDTVILGVPVYGGDIEREYKQFVRENWRYILAKRLALFICGMLEEKSEAEIKRAYPDQLLKRAILAENFGGRVFMDKLGFIERTAFKMVTKIKEDYSNLSEEKIAAFAERVNAARLAAETSDSASGGATERDNRSGDEDASDRETSSREAQ